MLKKGKKILAALLALAMAAAVFAACGAPYKSSPLGGNTAGEPASNGGFVAAQGDYVYFINGVESYTADNTYGTPVKGSLMRIAKSDLAAGSFAETEIVVPQLIVSQDYTSGIYVYGDRVYYASPTTAKNPDGDVENSYIDFKSSKLDGSETMSDYYVRMSNNATVFRYVADEKGTVYLLYIDTAEGEIRSYNTATGVNTVLAAGYQDAELNADDPTDPYVYYTMSVVKNYGYSESSPSSEQYTQLYRVSAFTSECPYEMDLSADYTDKETGKVLDYVNLGTLVLDGIGRGNHATPFNHDMKDGVTPYYGYNGVTYTLVKYTNGGLYYTNSENSDAAILYRLPADELDKALADGSWNSVTGNANNAGGSANDINERIAVGTDEAGESALFFEHEGSQYYMYVSGTEIVRVKVDEDKPAYKGESTRIVRGLAASSSSDSDSSSESTADAVLLFIEDGYLYFSQSAANGRGLYRVNCVGAASAYENLNLTDEYRATEYAGVEFDSDWYAPELMEGYLFFADADTYADGYISVTENPATNAELKARNEKYEDAQEVIEDMAAVYENAGDAARYYFYTGDAEILAADAHAEQYTEEDNEAFNAFTGCKAYGGVFDASVLKSGEEAWNVRSYFVETIGKMTDEDKESRLESLADEYLLSEDSASSSSDGWTWQWAAIFVPVGVVVIAAVAVTVILVKKNRRAA